MRAWFALLCAVALDVTGTMCLKFSSLGTFPLGAVVMAGCVAASYVLLKHSNGFQRPVPGVLALILIVVAFALLGQSLHTVALATAYATWGAAGVILTALLSRVLDGTALRPSAWAGLLLIGASMAALHSAG